MVSTLFRIDLRKRTCTESSQGKKMINSQASDEMEELKNDEREVVLQALPVRPTAQWII